MTFEEFQNSLNQSQPPGQISQNLQALWYDANGEWNKAHNIVQETSGFEGDWIHAYLHRKEGDLSNSSYWYSRVGKKRPDIPLDVEWEELVNYLLNN